MCGFVGFVDHLPEKAEVIEKMKDAIIHRGPDSDGTFWMMILHWDSAG